MIWTLIITSISIILMMMIWVIVQLTWKAVFPEKMVDEDALAGRSECGNCGCGTQCTRENGQEMA